MVDFTGGEEAMKFLDKVPRSQSHISSITSNSKSTSGSNGPTQAIRKHPLFYYFFITYSISYALLIPSVLSAWNILKGDFTLTFTLYNFAPAMAAIIMVTAVEGKAGLVQMGNRLRQWRAGLWWYLFILVGVPTLLMLGIIIQPGVFASFQGLKPALLVSYVLYFVVVLFVGGPLGEEIGWRGFALPRMQPRYGPLLGTVLLSIPWVFWHFPQFWMPTMGGGPGTGLTPFLVNLPLFFIMVMATAIIVTWVFNHTRGSIFTCVLLHTSIDVPQDVLIPLFLAVSYTTMFLGGVIAFGVTALLIVILTRGRLGYQPIQNKQEIPKEAPDHVSLSLELKTKTKG